MARATDVAGSSAEGFSLEEMKAVAAEAGFDPALVERAARMMPSAQPRSLLERVLGAPIRQRIDARYDHPLDDESAARLLSAIRAGVEQHGKGEANATGVSWHSIGGGTQWLVNAHSTGEETRVRISADRSAALAATGTATIIGTIAVAIATIVGFEVIELQSQLLGWSVLSGAILGSAAVGRAVWASMGRMLPARLSTLMETVDQSLESPESATNE